MAFEGVRRFGQRVSKLSRYHNSLGSKKRSKKKGDACETNKTVMGLIEQAGSDYAKGETDLAIYRLTQVLSNMERECTSLEENQAAACFVSPPVKLDRSEKPCEVAPQQEDHHTRKKLNRKLLLRDEIAYRNALQRPPSLPPCTELPPLPEPAQSHGTVIEECRIHYPKVVVPVPARMVSVRYNDGVSTLRNVETEVTEFSDLIERSFNTLTIGDSVAALDDDTTRFEDRVLFPNSTGNETVWSKAIANEFQAHTLETATYR
ncbi:uncharacterized protein LALA0_S12e01662g [Lachancea lanzarotensis]|uniref:LALA0S12e01662g1_1 n=1 Tax=Lachancea lanzarotensis TaxID=1245769 RepID=A0A0C7MX48_9SACH|nr:uncharacterized protein LALA0_S12e01662g [Lachancea lanzarotensis]CEP64558.1 LALA0S12e01662g1_1 [Lachancea lanzarotensis]